MMMMMVGIIWLMMLVTTIDVDLKWNKDASIGLLLLLSLLLLLLLLLLLSELFLDYNHNHTDIVDSIYLNNRCIITIIVDDDGISSIPCFHNFQEQQDIDQDLKDIRKEEIAMKKSEVDKLSVSLECLVLEMLLYVGIVYSCNCKMYFIYIAPHA